jgi:hypothetical protein
MDPKTWLSMVDMGMGGMHGMEGMEGHDMSGHSGQSDASQRSMQGHDMAEMRHGEQEHGKTGMPGHGMGNMHGMQHDNQPAPQQMPGHGKAAGNGMKDMKGLDTEPGVDARVMSPSTSLADPGPRLRDNGRRVLTYADLRTIGGPLDPRPPSREIVLRLTGNMQRFVWGFKRAKSVRSSCETYVSTESTSR